MRIICFLFFLTLPLLASAKSYQLVDKDATLLIDFSDHWLHLEKVLGVRHLFVSSTSTPKDSISVTNTTIDNLKLHPDQLRSRQKDYQKGRKEWAKSRDAKIIKFYPYENLKSRNDKIIHQIGFEYEKDKQRFSENSFYIECKKHFFHIKSTVFIKRSIRNREIVKSIVQSKCN